MPSLIDLMLEGRKIRAAHAVAARRGRCSVWNLPPASWRRAAGACSASGASRRRCTWRSSTGIRRKSPSSAWNAPIGLYPSVGKHHPPALRLERTVNDLFGLSAEGLPDTRHWLDHGRWGVRFPLGDRIDAPPTAAPYRFLPRKATACTRSRSVRCMPASSSPDISALPPAARPWSGWNSGWDIPTRASKG